MSLCNIPPSLESHFQLQSLLESFDSIPKMNKKCQHVWNSLNFLLFDILVLSKNFFSFCILMGMLLFDLPQQGLLKLIIRQVNSQIIFVRMIWIGCNFHSKLTYTCTPKLLVYVHTSIRRSIIDKAYSYILCRDSVWDSCNVYFWSHVVLEQMLKLIPLKLINSFTLCTNQKNVRWRYFVLNADIQRSLRVSQMNKKYIIKIIGCASIALSSIELNGVDSLPVNSVPIFCCMHEWLMNACIYFFPIHNALFYVSSLFESSLLVFIFKRIDIPVRRETWLSR